MPDAGDIAETNQQGLCQAASLPVTGGEHQEMSRENDAVARR